MTTYWYFTSLVFDNKKYSIALAQVSNCPLIVCIYSIVCVFSWCNKITNNLLALLITSYDYWVTGGVLFSYLGSPFFLPGPFKGLHWTFSTTETLRAFMSCGLCLGLPGINRWTLPLIYGGERVPTTRDVSHHSNHYLLHVC